MAKRSEYINRELSWLEFNKRVLEEAEDKSNPLFERLKFVSIFMSNLDEFYMVRVGSLSDQQLAANIKADKKTGMTPGEQLEAIFAATCQLLPRKDAAYRRIASSLAKRGVCHVNPEKAASEDEKYLSAYFKNEIQPLISPSVIDRRHPFPFLKNLEMNVGVQLAAKGKNRRFGVIPVSDMFRRLVRLPGEGLRFCLVEEIICHYAEKVFKNYTVLDKTIFKVTRNADINIQEGLFDEEVDYRKAMSELLKARRKLRPVRVDIYGAGHADIRKYIAKKLDLDAAQVFTSESPLDLKHVFSIEAAAQKHLPAKMFFPPLPPHRPLFLDPARPVLEQALEHDIFLSYPFEDMAWFIRLLGEAADDPAVHSIKITLYRVARNSKVIDALVRAADHGKQVFAVVELRARFDEQNNIDWTLHLEEAGVNVSYGLENYKTHSKLCLITRKAENGVQYITQVGTGNYNEKTARQYTDMALITADSAFGRDADTFFDNVSQGETTPGTQRLLIAPCCFRSRLLALMDEQIAAAKAGEPASIIIKANSLTDKPLIDKLIVASQAGVSIKLIIRGICCLRSGIPGISDNIEVLSIVGRFLEHSRIYSFGTGDAEKLYISSGDLMTRSTQTRQEIAAPIYDPAIRAELRHILETLLHDNVKARRQNVDGTYSRVSAGDAPPLNSQLYFFTGARYTEDKT